MKTGVHRGESQKRGLNGKWEIRTEGGRVPTERRWGKSKKKGKSKTQNTRCSLQEAKMTKKNIREDDARSYRRRDAESGAINRRV